MRKTILNDIRNKVPKNIAIESYPNFFHCDFLKILEQDSDGDLQNNSLIQMYKERTTQQKFQDFCFEVYKGKIPVSAFCFVLTEI